MCIRDRKYIGSNVSGIFREIKKILEQGISVLFSGTPCQVAGLKIFLQKEYENLTTCDFVCHGVASGKVLRKYLEFLEETNQDKINNVFFRKKTDQYINSKFTVTFTDKELSFPSYENPFGYGFSAGKINRESCASCPYASLYRASDLTLADLVHGLSKKERKNGASLVLVNTGKGKRRLEQCDLYKKQLDIAYAVKIQSHLSHPQKMSGQRSEILESLDRLPFSEVADRYLTPPAVPFRVRVKGGIKRLLGR